MIISKWSITPVLATLHTGKLQKNCLKSAGLHDYMPDFAVAGHLCDFSQGVSDLVPAYYYYYYSLPVQSNVE